MARLGRDRGRVESDQTQALSHPIRLRILELFKRDTDRALAAQSLVSDLAADYPGVEIRQVAYHVAVLRDADLLPG
jgi:DNA-binding transcriptional ArsR family regulator